MNTLAWRTRQWFEGTQSGDDLSTGLVMVDDPALVTAVAASEWASPHRQTLVRAGNGEIHAEGRYVGSLLEPDTVVDFGSGVSMAIRPYGLATMLSVDGPTVLRISDDDDFSAYLRDADRAWTQGVFSDAMTSPVAVIADVVALGWPSGPAGPPLRAFVFPDGEVSTSPSGTRLGRLEDGIAEITARWSRINAESLTPCAVSLSAVLLERDRVEALAERPWLSRYLVVADVLRAVRRDGRVPTHIAGFGVPTGNDGGNGVWAPVVLGVEGGFEVRDPASGYVAQLPQHTDTAVLAGLRQAYIDGIDPAAAAPLGSGAGPDIRN